MSKRALLLLGTLALLAGPPADAAAARKTRTALPKSGRLHSFPSCTSFLSYVRSYGARTLGAGSAIAPPGPAFMVQGKSNSGAVGGPAPATTPQANSGAPSPSPGGTAGTDFSGTNVQENGIDEPDMVKTDGTRIFSIENGKLYSVSVAGAAPRLLDKLDLEGYNHQLLLRGSRLLVISTAAGPTPVYDPGTATSGSGVAKPAIAPAYYPYYRAQTVLTEVDVSDPAAMKVVRTETVDGAYVDARQNGDTARVVIASRPRAFEEPGPVPLARSSARARAATAKSIRKAGISKWLPASALVNRRTGKTTHSRLVRCNQIRRPAVFSGLEMVTVLTINLDKGLPVVDTDAVMSDAETVYGSANSLYIASQKWVNPNAPGPDQVPSQVYTSIHRFDASEPGKTVYRSSGAVSGLLLNSWSLSESNGRLRVASTDEPTWFNGQVQGQPESFVTILKENGGNLETEGRVGGLGRGQKIYAVRYVGDTAFVVTFRQIDPLYTIDLSDPANPRVLGALELQGYSAYLHPVSQDLLLGVGQDATPEGRRAGTQLTLFDIRDLRNIRLIAKRVVSPGFSSSTVEFDPHAFLYWPPTKLAVLPLNASSQTGNQFFNGAVGYHIGPVRGVQWAGQVQHPTGNYDASIDRSLIAHGKLFTVSPAGVKASDIDDLHDLAFLAFPDATGGGEVDPYPGGGVVGAPAPLG